jgi:hypothetical protein
MPPKPPLKQDPDASMSVIYPELRPSIKKVQEISAKTSGKRKAKDLVDDGDSESELDQTVRSKVYILSMTRSSLSSIVARYLEE